ncbi:hypothetical protein EIN_240130 [Entamoeba invadens IP1]|uniref:EF-hand domain-containing protein n=1 Tax=Entamoeba invadens IP1 TaxID=370355 RepID=L7FP89_ENTIV|nr:hypothetical protein EIN_240130 [Entamoeba invadens IP1]ELP94490.1 hypothetical protein EIN_240130 [Entamoeba invadens IP1]|eukprot:XP_004261261.1 hypothetical protein EIN_240130 [Entamoeba invadens IP1]
MNIFVFNLFIFFVLSSYPFQRSNIEEFELTEDYSTTEINESDLDSFLQLFDSDNSDYFLSDNIFEEFFDGTANVFKKIIDTSSDVISDTGKAIGKVVDTVVEKADVVATVSSAVAGVSTVLAVIPTPLSPLFAGVSLGASKIAAIAKSVDTTAKTLKKATEVGGEMVVDNVVDTAKTLTKDGLQTIAKEALKQTFEPALQGIASGIGLEGDIVNKIASKTTDYIGDKASKLSGNALEVANDYVDQMGTKAKNLAKSNLNKGIGTG